MKTIKKAAYAKISNVVWIGNNHVVENPAGASCGPVVVSIAVKVNAEISGIAKTPNAWARYR